MLVCCDEIGTGEDFVNVRAIVRHVRMHQSGHFMVGAAKIGGHYLYLSGTYGSDGLPMTVSRAVWDRALPIPADIMRAMARSTSGHNSSGDEGPTLRSWARENISALRQAGSDLGSNAYERVRSAVWRHGGIDGHLLKFAERIDKTPEWENSVRRDYNTYLALWREHKREQLRMLTLAIIAENMKIGKSRDEIARWPYSAVDRAVQIWDQQYPAP